MTHFPSRHRLAVLAAAFGLAALAAPAAQAFTMDNQANTNADGSARYADPDIVVLGGGVSNLPGMAETVQAALPPHVFADAVGTRVRRHRHGDASGVRGAAWLHPA